jgi:hypothetical protein
MSVVIFNCCDELCAGIANVFGDQNNPALERLPALESASNILYALRLSLNHLQGGKKH